MNRPPRTCAVCLDLEGFHEDAHGALGARCEACRVHGRHDPEHAFTSGLPRAFALVRPRDVSGVSGTGLVMQGVVFADGRVAARWVTEGAPRSTVLWDSFAEWYDVHVRPHPENGSVVLFEDGRLDEPPTTVGAVREAADGESIRRIVREELEADAKARAAKPKYPGPVTMMMERFGEMM